MHTESIIQAVSEVTGITTAAMQCPTKLREVVTARHLAIYFIKKYCPGLSLKTIAGIFNRSDHSTAIHAVQAVQDLLDTDRGYREVYNLIEATLQANQAVHDGCIEPISVSLLNMARA